MSDVCVGNNYFGIMRTPEVEGMCIFPGCLRNDFGDVPNIIKINFLCKLNFLISPGTRVCNYHCTAREDEWTAVFESPNNCKNFGTTHVEAIVDLMRVSLNVVHGVVSEMLSNVLE